MANKRLALIGCGHLGQIVAEAYRKELLPGYELVGVLGRDPARAEALAAEAGCIVCPDLDALLALKPDFVVECASVKAVRDYALPILRSGAELILLSPPLFVQRRRPPLWPETPTCTWPAGPLAALTCSPPSPLWPWPPGSL